MADESQVEMLKRSVEEWNAWREAIRVPFPDLVGAELQNANLAGANFVQWNLHGARLGSADLRGANLAFATLSMADLARADLRSARVVGTDLHGANMPWANLEVADFSAATIDGNCCDANFQGADLRRCIFSSAALRGARFAGARLGGTVFADVDLSEVEGLEECVHSARSELTQSTLLRSPRLPLAFLRGCGLPEVLIDYLPSLAGRPFQFCSVFISYSTRDQDFADRLYSDLQNNGVRCWFAAHDIAGGRKIHEQIDEAIRVYDRLLVILSGSSMSSEWVKTEIANARQKELRQGRQVLFPISIVPYETVREWKAFDADTGKDSAREIREYYIPDFTRWDKDHAAYKAAFEKLLKGLKAEDEKPLEGE